MNVNTHAHARTHARTHTRTHTHTQREMRQKKKTKSSYTRQKQSTSKNGVQIKAIQKSCTECENINSAAHTHTQQNKSSNEIKINQRHMRWKKHTTRYSQKKGGEREREREREKKTKAEEDWSDGKPFSSCSKTVPLTVFPLFSLPCPSLAITTDGATSTYHSPPKLPLVS